MIRAASPRKLSARAAQKGPQAEPGADSDQAIEIRRLARIQQQHQRRRHRQHPDAAAQECPSKGARRHRHTENRRKRVDRPQLTHVLRPHFTAGHPGDLNQHTHAGPEDRRHHKREGGARGTHHTFGIRHHDQSRSEGKHQFIDLVGDEHRGDRGPPMTLLDHSPIPGSERLAHRAEPRQ